MYLLQIALATASAMLFSSVLQRRDPVTDWLVCGIAVLSLAQVIPFSHFGFGYIAAGVLAVTGAFPAAALAGLALDLAQITSVPMTAVLCLAYLTRLIPGIKRWMPCLSAAFIYILVMFLCGSWDLQPVLGLLAGGIAAYWIPGNPGISHRRGYRNQQSYCRRPGRCISHLGGALRYLGRQIRWHDEAPSARILSVSRA
jgi:hypothetical protein